MIGGVVDLALLSLFPKFGQESLEGLRETQTLEVNNGGVREDPKLGNHWGR